MQALPKHIVLLNGPPRCGKDALAGAFLKRRRAEDVEMEHSTQLMKFARPIRDAACATFPWLSEENFEERKEQALFPGCATLRQWMIAYSEEFMKPLLGQEVFGHLLWQAVKDAGAEVIVVSDCGFRIEVECLLTKLEQAGARTRVRFVRLHRAGTDFTHDSRSYFSPRASPLMQERDLENNGSLEQTLDALEKWMQ